MLSTIALDYFVDAAVTSQWEVDLNNMITRFHVLQDSLDFLALLLECCLFLHVFDQGIFNDLTTTVEEVFYLDDVNKGKINNTAN